MTPGGLELGGIRRLLLLKPLGRHAKSVRIYQGPAGVTAWELEAENARFLLLLSADDWRGLSGEGQALSTLTKRASSGELAELRAALHWNGSLQDCAPEVLMRYAACGGLGYDLRGRSWFHRELPFDLKKIDELNPRLAAARKLVSSVTIEAREAAQTKAYVTSNGVAHRVTVGESASCTCPWFMKHALSRGPCKHLLAVELVLEDVREAR